VRHGAAIEFASVLEAARQLDTRYARNKRVADACYQWRSPRSPRPRRPHLLRATASCRRTASGRSTGTRQDSVGLLRGRLRHTTTYDEHTAWGHRSNPPLDSCRPWMSRR
jgi:hypothetical protein